jgi:tRNA (guanine37-N1)-methyltransferase|tara:strand:+ start:530 stop:1261 length:732 start_codon:yes stop_codon:yes gene_type:complete
MNINVISVFPEIIEASMHGLTGKAFKEKKASLELFDLKKFSKTEYGSVDDSPYGGGEGMVISAEPLADCFKKIDTPGHVIYLTPQGKNFNQKKSLELSKHENLTFVCGRYEGIDQRFINNFVNEELSIGDYVLSGGEIAACVVIDTILRNIEGVIGNKESVSRDSFSDGKLKGHVYTRPKEFKGEHVPELLLSGNHKKIEEWKLANSLWVTKQKRPDLFKQIQLSEEEMILLRQYEDQVNKKT